MPKLKKRLNPMGDYIPSDYERKAYLYGIRNDIRISPKPVSHNATEWYVEIFSGGKWSHSKEKFGPVDVWKQVYAYYKYYYDKKC